MRLSARPTRKCTRFTFPASSAPVGCCHQQPAIVLVPQFAHSRMPARISSDMHAGLASGLFAVFAPSGILATIVDEASNQWICCEQKERQPVEQCAEAMKRAFAEATAARQAGNRSLADTLVRQGQEHQRMLK